MAKIELQINKINKLKMVQSYLHKVIAELFVAKISKSGKIITIKENQENIFLI